MPDMSLSDAKKQIQNMLPAGVVLMSQQIWNNLGIPRTGANEALVANALLALKHEGVITWRNKKYSRTSK